MFQKVTGMFMAVLLVGALASVIGCSSRGEDQVSAGEYPFAGPPTENWNEGRSSRGSKSSGTQYAVAHPIDPGSTDYYGQWAYAFGRDPSYDYYLAESDGYGWYDDDEFTDEYGYFRDELEPYGDWYEDDRYGWIWYPEYVSVGWRPYLYGHWVYTDWGWAWVSDDPWGSNTYHYGRWDCDASNRWFWVPDDVWAPAWVSWRYGGGWCGWAPLPPEARWSGVTLAYSDYLVPSTRWCFVPEGRLTSTRLRTYVAPIPEGRRIFRETRDVTRYASVSGRAAERGLRSDWIERRTGRNIPEYRLITRERGSRRDQVRGRTIVAPMPISPRTSERFRGSRSGARERFESRGRFEDRRIDRGDRRIDRGDRWNQGNRTREDRANRMRDLREERARSRGFERQQIRERQQSRRERDGRQQREFQRERSQRQQEFRQQREQEFRGRRDREQRQQEFRQQRERSQRQQEFRQQREQEFRGRRDREQRQQEFRQQQREQQEFQRQRGFERRDQRRQERERERGNSERRRSEMMSRENQRQQERAQYERREQARQQDERAQYERRERARQQDERARYERRERARQQDERAQYERREQARQQAQQAQYERREQARQQAQQAQYERREQARQQAEQARGERRQRAERRQQQDESGASQPDQPRGHGRGRGNR